MSTLSTASRRVALLARPGVVCDRLRGALVEAGAQLVLEADPTALEPAALDAAQVQVVLVALDAKTEEALDRFDAALQDPAIEVIYEEAELVAKREGWEAARWIRHLSAKLNGHGDVLPPGGEPLDTANDQPPAGSAARSSAENADAIAFDPFTAPAEESTTVAGGHAGNTGHAFDPLLAEAGFNPADHGDVAMVAFSGFDLDGMDAPADASVSTANAAFDGAEFDPDRFDPGRFDPVTADQTAIGDGDESIAFGLGDGDGSSLEDWRGDAAASRGEGFDQTFDGDFGALAASNESDPDARLVGQQVATAESDADEPRPLLELVDDDAGLALTGNHKAASDGRFKHDLAALDARIANLELVDDRVLNGPAQANGAVLVLAGIGGPDAVRQLLGALPEDFPRPVLVQQRLDGGRYDKLVAQMQRATAMLVKLAEPGMRALDGVIYILPAVVGVSATENGLQFNDAGDDVLSVLPAADSAVLLLSGSDPAQVDAAMKHSWAGALCLGQSPDGCYDAAAASELIARGAEAGQPAELAQRLAARWRS